jgi:hypothetical protein
MICFVLDILVYLLQAPRLTEFNGLVILLTDYDLAGGRSVTDKVKVGLLGSAEKRLHTPKENYCILQQLFDKLEKNA